jgi:hypothetical protein
MATRGRKPTATVVKLVTARPIRGRDPAAEPTPDGCPKPPARLTGRPRRLWRDFIARAWWLTRADSQKAFMWVHLAAEFEENPAGMLSARIAQLRALGSELGFDPAARARLGSDRKPSEADPLERHFQ